MKQTFLLLLCLMVMPACLLAQNDKPAKDSATSRKFYFPAERYSDSLALSNTIPDLGRRVLAALSDKEKKEFERMVMVYSLTGDYAQLIPTIDSVQKKMDDPLAYLELAAYSRVKSQSIPANEFPQAFAEAFHRVYDPLSFRKKVSFAMLDTIAMQQFKTDYNDLLDKRKEAKSDSLDLEEAWSLIEKYGTYSVYKQLYPLLDPIIHEQKYMPMYPAIKKGKFSGAYPVQGIDEFSDPQMRYKLLMELTGFAPKDMGKTAKKEINAGLDEVSRKLNLHVASGVPKKNIDLVIVVHGGAIFALLNNEKYKQKYKVDNPNIALIKELQDFGAKFIVCGQAMTFLRTEQEDLLPGIKLALTAQTVISTYQLKGYVYYDVRLE